jgi:ABC-type lipoprotein export system ATPase subunit
MTAGDADAAVIAHDVFCLYPTPLGQVAALRGLSLRVGARERVVVHGPNGSGKTTLLRVLSGEVAADAGTVCVAGTDLVGADDAERSALRSTGLGLVDQHHARTLRPELDVAGNVALQLRLAGLPAAPARARALESLDSLGLARLARRAPVTLSGGEAQRVAVCAALAHGPSVVLADEPTGELDREAAEEVYDLLVRAAGLAGAALLLVTHDARAVRVADRLVRIRDGRLSEEWHPHGDGPETLVVDDRGWVRLPEPLRRTAGVDGGVHAGGDGSGIVLTAATRGTAADRDAGAVGPARDSMAAAAPSAAARADALSPRSDADPVAVVRSVAVRRDSRDVLRDVSLTVDRGTVTVIQGPSGSGKTTLLRVLVGLERPDAGAVEVAGRDLGGLDRDGLAALRRAHVGTAAQSGSIVEALDVAGNLALARQARGLAADPDEVDHWIDRLDLHALRHRPVGMLSGGERQRVAVGRALVVRLDLVVLDEPTSQQDEAHAERLVAVLADAADGGTAVVATTHDPVLVGSADAVLRLG